jgi:hypothetical protein
LQREVLQLQAEEKRLERENDMLQEELSEIRYVMELREKASPTEPLVTMSRATTRATSGIASPTNSNPRSAASPPGGLIGHSNAARLYSSLAGSAGSFAPSLSGSIVTPAPIQGAPIRSPVTSVRTLPLPAQELPQSLDIGTSKVGSAIPSSRISYATPSPVSLFTGMNQASWLPVTA